MVGLDAKSQQLHRALMLVMSLVAMLAVSWSFLWPLTDPTANLSEQEPASPPKTDEVTTDFATLAEVAESALRPTIAVRPTADRHLVQKVPLPTDVRLVVTMIESDRRSALFSIGDGDLKLCQEGEVISGTTPIEVVAIKPAIAVVRYLGQESRLTVPGARPADDG